MDDYTQILKDALKYQESIAPRSGNTTTKNHYISQFFQRYWGEDNWGYVLYRNASQATRVNFKNTMMENNLYTVKQMSHPNLFEAQRSQLESVLAQSMLTTNPDNFRLSPEESGLLISLILCSSPIQMDLYKRAITEYDKDGKLGKWGIRALASMMMLDMVIKAGTQIANDYTFRTVKTFIPLVLSDYPVAQILNGSLIHKGVGYYPGSDQILLPLGPHFYLEATKRDSQNLILSDLGGESLNDMMVISAERMLIGHDLVSVMGAVAKFNKGDVYEVAFPKEIASLVVNDGSIKVLTRSNDGIFAEPVEGYAEVISSAYEENGIILRSEKGKQLN